MAQAPRRILIVSLSSAIAAVACLAWLGWRLLDQERVVEDRRASEQLEVAVDRVARSLRRSLDDLDRALSAEGGPVPAGAVRFQNHYLLAAADGAYGRAVPAPFVWTATGSLAPSWTADSRSVFVSGLPDKDTEVVMRADPTTGAASEFTRVVREPGQNANIVGVSRDGRTAFVLRGYADGRWLIYVTMNSATPASRYEMWQVPVTGGEPRTLGITHPSLYGLAVHPDGTSLYYVAGDRSYVDAWLMEHVFEAATKVPAPVRAAEKK